MVLPLSISHTLPHHDQSEPDQSRATDNFSCLTWREFNMHSCGVPMDLDINQALVPLNKIIKLLAFIYVRANII